MSYNIDLQEIAEELDFDLEDVEDLIEVFLESSKESLEQLKTAIKNNDKAAMILPSHAIKGSAANLTLMEISSLAQDIELSAKEDKEISYSEKFELLRSAIYNL